jgi:cytidylate kinase
MYRAVALDALRNEYSIDEVLNNLKDLDIQFNEDGKIFLNGEDVSLLIRTSEVTNMTPIIASNPGVREHLVAMQQKIGSDKAVVMDGRDIGSVVFPNAELKIFQIASVKARALRRHNENIDKGLNSDLVTITKDIEKRDYQDMNRDVSPLIKCSDVIELDTSDMSVQQVVDKILELVKERVK